MSTNERKPRRTFDREFNESAVKLVISEGYSFAAAAKAVKFLIRPCFRGVKSIRRRTGQLPASLR
jgi:hypothetical protein